MERATVTKFLGVWVDENLSWKTHAKELALKVSKSLGVLNRVKHVLSDSVLTSLYFTMIQPYLTYCSIIWGGANKSTLKKLTVMQKRALRLITHSPYRTSCNPLFIRTRILKLPDIHTMQILLFVYKVKNNLLPSSSSQHLIPYVKTYHYELRKVPVFQIFSFHTEIRKKYIAIAGPKLWNLLPAHLINSDSFLIFKNRLFNFLSCSYV